MSKMHKRIDKRKKGWRQNDARDVAYLKMARQGASFRPLHEILDELDKRQHDASQGN